MKKEQTLLAIIFVGHGSTYFSSSDKGKNEMAATVVKRCVRDMKSYYKIKKNDLWPVHFYDITGFESWSADYSGIITEPETGKKAEFIETLKVVY
tara:strand:+ start:76 stop:360 length:285 start_codon:yes stop_codon:yes gene_type:complete